MTNTTRLTVVVDLPDDLCAEYLQHIKDFSDKHNCEFLMAEPKAAPSDIIPDIPKAH